MQARLQCTDVARFFPPQRRQQLGQAIPVFQAHQTIAQQLQDARLPGMRRLPPAQLRDRTRDIVPAQRDLRARQFHAGDFERFDLIVAMDADNLARIEALRPAGSTTPVRLFTGFAGRDAGDHVPDPYYTRDFDGCLDLIEICAKGLIETA